jgi:hypothetical protein
VAQIIDFIWVASRRLVQFVLNMPAFDVLSNPISLVVEPVLIANIGVVLAVAIPFF